MSPGINHRAGCCCDPATAISYILSQCSIVCPNTDCDGSEANIVTTPALSNLHDSDIGKTIKISGFDECWEVTEGFSAVGAVAVTKTNTYDACVDCCDPCGFSDGMSYPRDNDDMEFSVTFDAVGLGNGPICEQAFLCGGSHGAFPTFTFGIEWFEGDCDVTDPGERTQNLVWNYNPSGAGGDTNWRFRRSVVDAPYSEWRRGSFDPWDIIQDDIDGFEWVNGCATFLSVNLTITNNPCENPLP